MSRQRLFDGEGHSYWLDEDRERHYDLPVDWNFTHKAPEDMNDKELCAAVAQLMGCNPEWWPYYKDWVCGCHRLDHACDSQCSSIADYVTDSRHARRVTFWLEQLGLPVPRMTATGREVCLHALRVGRKA